MATDMQRTKQDVNHRLEPYEPLEIQRLRCLQLLSSRFNASLESAPESLVDLDKALAEVMEWPWRITAQQLDMQCHTRFGTLG